MSVKTGVDRASTVPSLVAGGAREKTFDPTPCSHAHTRRMAHTGSDGEPIRQGLTGCKKMAPP